MSQLNFKTHRRGFLGTLASGAATLGFMGLSPFTAKAGEIFSPLPDSGSDADAWFNQFKGKHKIVYDVTDPHDGLPLAWSWVFLNTNNTTGTQDSDLSVCLILRHEGIPMALENRLWDKYDLGKRFKVDDKKTNAPSKRNIFYNAQEGDLMLLDWSMEKLQARGVKFCVCNMAIHVYSMLIGKDMNLNPDDVEKDIHSGILKDIQPVPSGVWAVGRAQEHGLNYCFAG